VRKERLLPPRCLLDVVCNGFEKHLATTYPHLLGRTLDGSGRRYVYTLARDHVRRLLGNKSFLNAIRNNLPAHEIEDVEAIQEIDFWRMLCEHCEEFASTEKSEADLQWEDAPALAHFAQVLTDSGLAALRGS
jgi:hypothetical protein